MSLHDALIMGDFKNARRLISRFTAVNKPDEYGYTPLMLTVIRPGKERLTQLLLAAGAHVDKRNVVGETALMLALHNPNNQENVRIVVHTGTDSGLVSRYGYCACDYALKHSSYDWLFPDNTERRVVRTTLINANHNIVEAMCRKQPVDANLFCLSLLDAVYSEDVERVELLLEMGAPANCSSILGRSPLMQASCRTHLKLVRLLLRYGADPAYQDHEEQTALSEMATCVPGLRMTELIYCEEYAEKELGKERMAEIKTAQGKIKYLLNNAAC